MAVEVGRRRHHHHHFFLLLLLLALIPSFAHAFVIPLTHRDSPASPYFDPNATLADRWRAAHRRSLAHHGLLRPPSDGLHEVGGEYHLTLKLGLPVPVTIVGFIDVAGPLILTPSCDPPFRRCRWPHGKLYDPDKSASKMVIDCDDPECAAVQSWCAGFGGPTCYLAYEPVEGSRPAIGAWMYDVAVLGYDGPYTVIPGLRFVYTKDDSMGTRTAGTRIGLTGSHYALVHQLGSRVNYRFAHCFGRGARSTNSHLRFNDSVELTGLFMPLTLCTGLKYNFQMHYAPPPLVDISVQLERLNIPSGTFRPSCNVIFDSLSPMTFLPKPAYDMVAAAVVKLSKLHVVPPSPSPWQPVEPWGLCFQGTEQDITLTNLPPVALHLEGDAELGLDVLNAYAQVDSSRVCLLMAPTGDDRASIGTIAQQNFDVAYDLKKMEMAINPKTCE